MAYDWRTSTVAPWTDPGRVAPTGAGYVAPASLGGLEPVYPTTPPSNMGALGLLSGVGMAVTQPPAAQGSIPIAGAIPAALGALGVGVPAWLAAILGVAAAGYAGYQALGGGEGGGLLGLNVLGGDESAMGGLEFGGPGLPEPTAPYTEWHSGNKQFYYVPQYSPTTGKFLRARVAMYNKDTKKWKVWTLPKPHLAVIGKNAPSHRMLTRLRHNLRRHTADAKTILQVASPAYYAKMSGYRKYGKRR